MNKFALVFCLILIMNFSQEDEINLDYESIYDLLINVFKGLSATDENLCANYFVINKPKVLEIIRSLIEELKSGKSFFSVIRGYAYKFLNIGNILNDCRIMHLISSFKKLLSLEGIKAMGGRISKNAETLYDYFEIIKSAKGLDNKLVYVGKCLKIILDIYVH